MRNIIIFLLIIMPCLLFSQKIKSKQLKFALKSIYDEYNIKEMPVPYIICVNKNDYELYFDYKFNKIIYFKKYPIIFLNGILDANNFKFIVLAVNHMNDSLQLKYSVFYKGYSGKQEGYCQFIKKANGWIYKSTIRTISTIN